MAQATATKIYEHNGKKYRLADKRDVGNNFVRFSDTDFDDAMNSRIGTISTLTEINDDEFPFCARSTQWKLAFVETAEVAPTPAPAVVPFNGTLEVGQWYETNNGQRLHCNSRTHHDTYPMVMVQEDGCVETYMEKGLWIEDYDMDDECSIALQLVGCTGFDWTKPVEPAVVVEPEPKVFSQSATTEILDDLCKTIHAKNVAAGWWDAADNPLIVPVKLMLAVTELAEACEGDRKTIPDTHLPHRSMLSVELADAVIRIVDLAGFLKVPLGTVIAEKEAYNASRADHKPEVRKAANGKRY